VLPVSVDIGNIAFFADPDAFVDAPPQMFGELAVDMSVDKRSGRCGIDLYVDIGGAADRLRTGGQKGKTREKDQITCKTHRSLPKGDAKKPSAWLWLTLIHT